MLATSYKVWDKVQSRVNLGFTTASNQNEVLAHMTDFSYTSIIWLTQGKYAIVDNEDYERLSEWKWYFNKQGYPAGHPRRKAGTMHRFIMNTPKGMETDHINGVTHDNRKANLRVCTRLENQRNRGLGANNSSGYKGVSKHGLNNQGWRSRIKFGGKYIFLGYYKNAIDAARAYNKAALEMYGEFARINNLDTEHQTQSNKEQ